MHIWNLELYVKMHAFMMSMLAIAWLWKGSNNDVNFCKTYCFADGKGNMFKLSDTSNNLIWLKNFNRVPFDCYNKAWIHVIAWSAVAQYHIVWPYYYTFSASEGGADSFCLQKSSMPIGRIVIFSIRIADR